MSIAFPLLAMFGSALYLSVISKKPYELTLVTVVCCTILVLFLGGSLGYLPQTRLLFLAVGLAAFGWVAGRHRGEFLAFLRPGPVVIGVMSIGFAILNRNSMLLSWDEFSHWGQITRHISNTDAFPTRDLRVLFQDYPLGAAVIQYLFAIGNAGDERFWLFAANFVKLSAFLTLFVGLKWQDAFLLFAIAIFVIISPHILHMAASWHNLLIDLPVALLAASAFIVYWKGGGDTRAILLSLPIFAALPLIKETGFILGAVVFAVMIADQLIRSMQARKMAWKPFIAVMGCFVAMLFVRLVWSWHLVNIKAGTTFKLSPAHIYARIKEADFASTLISIMDKVYEAVSFWSLGPTYLTFVSWGGILLALSSAAILISTSLRKAISVFSVHIVLFVFFIAYLAILLTTYLFAFTSYEAVQIAGFSRYVNSYLMMWVLIALALLIQPIISPLRHIIAVGVVFSFLAFAGSEVKISLASGYKFQDADNPVSTARKNVRVTLGKYQSFASNNAKVYSVWNNSAGQPHYMTSFEITPRTINLGCFGLGPKRHPEDIWSCDMSPRYFINIFNSESSIDNNDRGAVELREDIQSFEKFRFLGSKYNYLFIGSSDDVFWDTYGTLFQPGSRESKSNWFVLDLTPQGAKIFRPVFF